MANLVEIKARGKFNRRHMFDIPRIKFFAQRRYQANWPFVDGHYLARWPSNWTIKGSRAEWLRHVVMPWAK
jgi:hypothetical protein